MKKKDMIPLTKKEEENYDNQKVCYICKKEFNNNDTAESSSSERKKNYKVRDHCHYRVNIEVLPITFVI